MGLFKADFYRFFALGFAVGTALVAASLGIGGTGDLSRSVVPSAVAAPAQ